MPDYNLLAAQAKAFADAERDYVPLLANVSALLFESLERINWAGFYLMDRGRLLLGPFQGKPACIRIEIGKGVCGTAVQTDQIQRVADVHTFPGHIACDAASASEIVVPIHSGGMIVGVLDIDSPEPDRFDQTDEDGLLKLVIQLEEAADFSRLRIKKGF